MTGKVSEWLSYAAGALLKVANSSFTVTTKSVGQSDNQPDIMQECH